MYSQMRTGQTVQTIQKPESLQETLEFYQTNNILWMLALIVAIVIGLILPGWLWYRKQQGNLGKPKKRV